MQQTQTVTGALGFGVPVTVAGHGSGIVTWLPSPGRTVKRGQQLYRVNDRPVTVFYGRMPLFRTLAPAGGGKDAATGNDVDLVAANLAALGYYSGSTHDAVYDAAMVAAVKDWQRDLGVEDTGALAAADVDVTVGAVRVASVAAHLGDDAAADVLAVTSTRKVITLKAPESLTMTPGMVVSVALPDGTTVRTKVQHVGATTTPTDGSPPSVPVTVRPANQKKLAVSGLGR